MMTNDPEVNNILLMGVALAIGLLIGVERGWSKREIEEGKRIAGLRTFGLMGLLGGCIGLLTKQNGSLLLGLTFLGFCGVLTAAYVHNIHKSEDISITSLVASLLTFLLGSLATQGFVALAGSITVITALLLGFKPVLHGWVKHLEQKELYAGLKLLLISVVLLSILPNKSYGPFEAFNPFEIWWLVVLMSSISFLAYFAIKLGGKRNGLLLTAFLSGMISSTALTLHFARLSHQESLPKNIISLGILIACSMMFLRMLVFITILNPSLLQHLMLPICLLAAITILPYLIVVGSRLQTPENETNASPINNPLELKPALLFGALLTIISFLSRVTKNLFGDIGLYGLAVIAGFVDVDAITLTYSRFTSIEPIVIARAIIIGGCFNTLFKGILAASVGGKHLLKNVTLPLTLTAIVGISYCFAL